MRITRPIDVQLEDEMTDESPAATVYIVVRTTLNRMDDPHEQRLLGMTDVYRREERPVPPELLHALEVRRSTVSNMAMESSVPVGVFLEMRHAQRWIDVHPDKDRMRILVSMLDPPAPNKAAAIAKVNDDLESGRLRVPRWNDE